MQQNWKGLGGPGTLGLELVVGIALGLFGGNWLDKRFGTSPWFTLVGLTYGIAAGARAIYRALKKANRELEKIDREEREARQKFQDGKPTDHEQ